MSWLEVVPQIITAGASLGGVLIGLLINGQRESKRFKKQMEFEARKLTYDRVRDVSVRLIRAHADQSEQYEAGHWQIENLYAPFSREKLRLAAEERYAAEVELSLLVPELEPVIDTARKAVWQMDESDEPEPVSTNTWLDLSRAHQAELRKLEDEIRRVLSLEEPKRRKSKQAATEK